MQCPVCDERMKEVERMGVSIDICPGCKGVWLDRGELDKIVELSRRSETAGLAVPQAPRHGEPGFLPLKDGYPGPDRGKREHDRDDDHRDRHDHHDHRDRERYARGEHDRGYGLSHERRRGSWLADLFGGDD